MLIEIELETEEEKEWYENNLESEVTDAIFEHGATVIVNGSYHVIGGYNNAYHQPKNQNKVEDNSQSKLTSL